MTNSPFDIASLVEAHNRLNFKSGSAPLDRYLKEQATQDIRRRITACFVACHEEHIIGYYTLASTSIPLSALPPGISKKLPRYPTVPAVRMGRLAVDEAFKGQGLGGALLADAISRTCRSEIAAYALIVDAKDKMAVSFYQHHGFILLPDTPMTLFLPLATVKAVSKK
ncbi:MAG: GNAT family N-acetyltransferase [Gammaproteobacteria bacterium]